MVGEIFKNIMNLLLLILHYYYSGHTVIVAKLLEKMLKIRGHKCCLTLGPTKG